MNWCCHGHGHGNDAGHQGHWHGRIYEDGPQAKAMDRAGVDAAPISATWEVVKGLSSRSVRVPAGRGVWRSLSARSGR